MSARIVCCDSSVLVALLIDNGSDGRWAAEQLADAAIAAPTLIYYESANVILRNELAGLISPDQAKLAHADLLDLTIEQWPYLAVAARAWELRKHLSSYDAGYVALAELIGVPLVTLDRRIRRAPGVRCPIAAP